MTREIALAALAARRRANLTRVRIDNAALVAGSPMYFDCAICQDEIVVAEHYLARPTLCPACEVLRAQGWLRSELRLAMHTQRPGDVVVEIWYDGEFIGQITAMDGPGCKLISKYNVPGGPIFTLNDIVLEIRLKD